MDQNIETPISHYNNDRKRSFFFSRLFVILSMVVLLIALGINMSFLYSQQRTSTTSQASNPNPAANLPALPDGCGYQTVNDKVTVVCPKKQPSIQPTQTAQAQNNIVVELPRLPATCSYQTSAAGYAVTCANPQTIIPTVAVELSATEAARKITEANLPALPKGCVYEKTITGYVVACSAKN